MTFSYQPDMHHGSFIRTKRYKNYDSRIMSSMNSLNEIRTHNYSIIRSSEVPRLNIQLEWVVIWLSFYGIDFEYPFYYIYLLNIIIHLLLAFLVSKLLVPAILNLFQSTSPSNLGPHYSWLDSVLVTRTFIKKQIWL